MDKEKDILGEIIKEKLSNYSLPVDDDSWSKIEEQLNSATGGKSKRLWFAAMAVAASITLLLILFQFNNKDYQNETANLLSNHEEEIVQNVPETEIVQSDLQQNVEHTTVFRKPQSGKQLAENELTAEVIPNEEVPKEGQNIQETAQSSVKENPTILNVSDLNLWKEVEIPAIRNKKRQSINFSLGSGRNLLAKNDAPLSQGPYRVSRGNELHSSDIVYSDIIYYNTAVQSGVPTPTTEDIIANEYYSDAVHYPPVSFGVTVRKDLDRTIAIETGIVYSFIATSFSKEDFYKSKAGLYLHYIGIPLNIHTRLYGNRNSQWGVYLSTGGMVEKGFLSHFVHKTFLGDENSVRTVRLNEKIKGLQWSVGISPGIDYQIYKNYSIYLEPKLSYYFDNNQPESARTKHPVVVGMNAGIRFEW